jgi:MFS family permease
MGLGPVIGGILVSSVGWRSIFWINVPIGALAFILTGLYIPESKAAHARRFDPAGQGLFALALAGLTFGIIEGAHRGWESPLIIASFGIFGAAGALFVVNEARRPEPLLQLQFFRSTPFSGATVIAVAYSSALGGFLFLNTLYLQQTRGLSALDAGLDTLPMAAMTVIAAPLAGRLIGRKGTRPPLLIAGFCLTASGVMLTRIGPSTSLTWLFGAYVLFGAGFGMASASTTTVAVSGMPNSQAGVAAAVASTSRQVGLTLGVAILGALVTAGINGSAHRNLAVASHPAWWAVAACGSVVFGVGAFITSPGALASARRAMAPIEPADLGGHAASALGGAGRAPRRL